MVMIFPPHNKKIFYLGCIINISSFISLLLFSCGQKSSIPVNKVEVPEGYSVEVAAGPDLVDYPMFCSLDETGRLFVFESVGNVYDKTEDALNNPQFRIKLLEDINEDGIYDKSTVFLDKIGFPQGGVFYKGSLYASSAPDLLKLTDTTGDGVADKREVILSGWTLNVNANSLVGPFIGPDGWLYMSSAIMGFNVKTKEGIQLKGETSRIWRVRTDGSGLEWISAGGMNNPVELTFTEAAEPIGTETYFTDPSAGERDALVYWTEGGVYPKPNTNINRDKLVRTGELLPVVSKYSRVSPAGITRYRSAAPGNDFTGNLFSAQFNTHRVIRHKLFRDGASFRTEDEVFFEIQNENSHPTDVAEDADGSLLVVETGGWFIKGCPLSQVSKPELKGSIYRIRKKDIEKIQDPYGNTIRWKTLMPGDASKYLADWRPFVCDRAQQLLADMGATAIPALKAVLSDSSNASTQTKAIFTLYRIGTQESIEQIRMLGLNNRHEQVRIAAARSLGLFPDHKAVFKLAELILNDTSLAVIRQCATALGQIGDRQAVTSLMASAEKNEDRFVRHAIIYALVLINEPDQVIKGLTHHAPSVNEAALIALDQMEKSVLRPLHIMPFLSAKKESLRNSALWVASHHPDWSYAMIGFLNNRINKGPLNADETKLFTELVVSFSDDPQMQRFIAEKISSVSKEYKLFFLDAMAKCPLKKFPVSWTLQVGQQLVGGTDPEVKAAAMKLVSLREINTLSEKIRMVISDKNNPSSLRIDAIAVLLTQDSIFSTPDFDYLSDQLKLTNEAPLRLKSAYALGQGKLSETQLRKLAKQYLVHADPFILPHLVTLFSNSRSGDIGITLAATLLNSPALDGFSEDGLKKIFSNYPAEVRPEVDKLMVKLRQVRSERLKRLEAFESQIGNGVLDRGRQLFFGKATCSICHSIGKQGGNFGPDLTSIQRDRSSHDLLEAIVYPDASFVREFETYKVKTNSGDYLGILKERSPEAIRIDISSGHSIRIADKDILSIQIENTSMMPQGLDKLLSAQEMADLMAFLLGQDQDPETDQKILRHNNSNL